MMLTSILSNDIIALESSEQVNAQTTIKWEKSHIFFKPVLENSEHANNTK